MSRFEPYLCFLLYKASKQLALTTQDYTVLSLILRTIQSSKGYKDPYMRNTSL